MLAEWQIYQGAGEHHKLKKLKIWKPPAQNLTKESVRSGHGGWEEGKKRKLQLGFAPHAFWHSWKLGLWAAPNWYSNCRSHPQTSSSEGSDCGEYLREKVIGAMWPKVSLAAHPITSISLAILSDDELLQLLESGSHCRWKLARFALLARVVYTCRCRGRVWPRVWKSCLENIWSSWKSCLENISRWKSCILRGWDSFDVGWLTHPTSNESHAERERHISRKHNQRSRSRTTASRSVTTDAQCTIHTVAFAYCSALKS